MNLTSAVTFLCSYEFPKAKRTTVRGVDHEQRVHRPVCPPAPFCPGLTPMKNYVHPAGGSSK